MRRRTNRSEVRRYFRRWLDTAFRNNLMDRNKRERTLTAMERHVSRMVVGLNRSGTARLDLGSRYLKIFLREGRNPSSGSGFNLFEIQWSGNEHRKELRCFLGSRFVPAISDALRTNLRYVLEPSGIELVWSGMDMAAVGFFNDIIEKIRGCDFCIFDNRLTARKPNVYIEVGIAYVLGKPFILANYKGNSARIPSDLAHISNIDYTSYKDLSETLYFNLPSFLLDVGLRKHLPPRRAS